MSGLTTCTLDCPDRCSIVCRVEAGGIRLRGNPDHPYTRGFTCAKIRRYPHRLQSPHRIREPWVRRGDQHRPVSWEEALDTVSAALRRALKADPASALLIRGNGSMGVSKAFAEHVFRGLGARLTRGSLCDAAGRAAIEADAGRLDMNDPGQIEAAEAIVLWGKNPRASSIHTAAQTVRARSRGVPVMAVNPDASGVRSLTDRIVRVRPGTDRFLALACAKLAMEMGTLSPPWGRAANREAFEALLNRYPLWQLLDACGVSETEAREIASVYVRTPKVATIVGLGVQRHAFGGENVRCIHALAFVAGTLGEPGGGLYYSTPSVRHLTPPRVEPSRVAPLVLPSLAHELPAARPPIRFVWIAGSNVLNQGLDAKATRAAFAGVETTVSVEAFWTETARRADVVLPPTLWLEEEDVVGSYWHNTVGFVRRVVDPPEGCRTDFDILRELARRLDLDVPFRDLSEWLAAWLPKRGPGLEDLRRDGWVRIAAPQVAWKGGFAHPDKKMRLIESVTDEPPEDPAHPLAFLTLIRRDALNSQMLPEEQSQPLPVRVHPDTAFRARLSPGAPVRLASVVGELEGELHLDPELRPGIVAAPRGGWLSLGLGVNEATQVRITDSGDGAAYYSTGVRLERVSEVS